MTYNCGLIYIRIFREDQLIIPFAYTSCTASFVFFFHLLPRKLALPYQWFKSPKIPLEKISKPAACGVLSWPQEYVVGPRRTWILLTNGCALCSLQSSLRGANRKRAPVSGSKRASEFDTAFHSGSSSSSSRLIRRFRCSAAPSRFVWTWTFSSSFNFFFILKRGFFWGAEKREYSRVLLPYSERKNKVSRRLLACTGSVLVRRTGLSGWTHTHAHGVCGSGFDRYTSVLHSCMYVVRHSVLFVLLTTGSLASRPDGGGIDLWLILGFKWNHLHKAVCMRCIQRWGVQNKRYPFIRLESEGAAAVL